MVEIIWPFVGAGCIGVFVAVFHGIVVQKKMVTPILRDTKLPDSTRRLVPLLLHFSTIFWLLGGIALASMPFFLPAASVATTAYIVAALYLVGAIGNLWGTRGRHPGWILLLITVALIAYGVSH